MLTGILQPTHLIIILALALLFLGPKRLPGVGRALGEGLKEFKSSLSPKRDDAPQQPVSGSANHQEDASGGDAPS